MVVPVGLEPTVSLRSVNSHFLLLLPPLAAQEKMPHRCAFTSQGAIGAGRTKQTHKKTTHKGWFFSVVVPVGLEPTTPSM